MAAAHPTMAGFHGSFAPLEALTSIQTEVEPMPGRGDGLLLRGSTWWLDFRHQGRRHQVRIGQNINRTVAGELATVERGKILRGEAGIGGRKRKDMRFERAAEEFLKGAEANKRPGTVEFYRYCLQSLGNSFNGKMLSQIHCRTADAEKGERGSWQKISNNRGRLFQKQTDPNDSHSQD